MASEPLVVQAIYSYKRTNNDELNFKKGDIITVTQKDEGWWEGTLNGQTGWFPSNYVKESKDAPKPVINQQNQYKGVVLKDLIDSEKAHVTELEGLVTNFLQPLEKSSTLTPDEYKQLTGNITEVLETHQQLLSLIEAESNKPGNEQRVGKLFLTWAPRIKNVHQAYCSLHPRAVCILDKYRDELTKYMESKGAASPGVLVLTTMLSKPFRRLDKYSGMLQELERHVEECHPDRGDTQRSVSVYKDIAATCSATRRQKELELQVLTGPVRGWEGPSLNSLGDIIYMGSVAIGPQHHDRYFVLFPTTLVILSVSHRLSAFIYEGKLFLSGLTAARLEDSDQYKNAFEISAPMIDKRIAVCQSKDEADHWVDLLRKQTCKSSTTTNASQKVTPSQAQFVPQPPPHSYSLNQRGYCNRTSVLSYQSPLGYAPVTPPENYPSTSPYAALTRHYYKLIKSKVITRRLLKQLLYSEYLNKFNLSLVKIRHYKTETSIFIKDVHCRDSIINCDSDSDSDSMSSSNSDNASFKFKRQDKVTSGEGSSTSSNQFGYVWYYNPKTGSERQETLYECYEESQPEADSRPKLDLLKSPSVSKPIKQISEESEASANIPEPKPYMACEDLHTLEDNLELKKDSQGYLPTMSPLIAGSGTNQPSNRPHHQQGVNIAHSTPTPPPHNSIHSNRGWSSICLRPTPPLRPCLALGTSPNGPYSRYSRKPMSYKEDGLILDVIEAYCSLAKPRSTVNSVNVADALKSDKVIPEAIQQIQSKLSILEYNVSALTSQLGEEKEARRALQNIVKNYLVANSKELGNIEWPTIESNI